MAISYTTSASWSATFVAAGTAVSNAFDAGSAANRVLLVFVAWNGGTGHTIDSVTYNGVTVTAAGAAVTSGARCQLFVLAGPASGSNTLTVDPSTGASDSPALIIAQVYDGVDQTTATDGYTSNTGSDAGAPFDATVTVTSATGDHVAVFFGERSTSTTCTATGYTERQDVNGTSITASGGDQAGAASVATTCTFAAGPITFTAMGINMNAAAGAAAWVGLPELLDDPFTLG